MKDKKCETVVQNERARELSYTGSLQHGPLEPCQAPVFSFGWTTVGEGEGGSSFLWAPVRSKLGWNRRPRTGWEDRRPLCGSGHQGESDGWARVSWEPPGLGQAERAGGPAGGERATGHGGPGRPGGGSVPPGGREPPQTVHRRTNLCQLPTPTAPASVAGITNQLRRTFTMSLGMASGRFATQKCPTAATRTGAHRQVGETRKPPLRGGRLRLSLERGNAGPESPGGSGHRGGMIANAGEG
ncbi:unnamed protein product [Rangifer tarandus platyrhynchus]|uniref:Uncharacterized protein n=1 Tax=Rangifer tarandus platyrhynchus TaxID=3082113 RepID=A0ABN8ZQF4_RANTA|nr:unnamed protein product [Rangifer tarandus platyrhynchus]